MLKREESIGRNLLGLGLIPDAHSRLPLLINSVIIDREAGASIVENIWGDKLNVQWIANFTKAHGGVRNDIAKFLIANGSERVWAALIEGKTFRSGILFSAPEVVRVCSEMIGHDAGAVLAELYMPIFVDNGLVATQSKFSIRRKVGHGFTTIEDLVSDIAAQDIERAITETKVRFKVPSGVHSVAAMGEIFSDAYMAVGRALANVNDYEQVLGDIITGVLANIDAAPLLSQRGSVPEYIEKNEVVQQLQHCWNFIHAALSLRASNGGMMGAGKTTINCDAWKFNKYAPIVMTMIRNSQRYQLVSKSEYVATLGTRRIFDLTGKPRSVVVYDNAFLEPAAMAVMAIKDLVLEETLNLSELPDRVSERVSSAYGSVAEVVTLERAAEHLADQIQMAIESDPESKVFPLYNARLASSERELDLMTAAVLLADRVSARFGEDIIQDGKDDEVRSSFGLVLSGKTTALSYEMKSGGMINGEFMTQDPAEFFLLVDDIKPASKVAIPAQLIPRTAMRSRVYGYDDTDFIKTTDRLGYKMDILGVSISGVVRLRELTTIRLSDQTSLVCPHHNRLVYSIIHDVIRECYDVAAANTVPAMQRRALRMLGGYVLTQSQAVSPGFRAEIHGSMIERAVEGLPYTESMKMRATLRQQAMSAYADVTASNIFFTMQGIVGKENVLSELSRDKRVVEYWIEVGSDR